MKLWQIDYEVMQFSGVAIVNAETSDEAMSLLLASHTHPAGYITKVGDITELPMVHGVAYDNDSE